jgi:hypothetical protein
MAARKRLSLDAAASKLAIAMQKHMKSLSPLHRRKRLKALDALARIAASRIRRNRDGSPSRPGSTHRTPAYPFAAKAR